MNGNDTERTMVFVSMGSTKLTDYFPLNFTDDKHINYIELIHDDLMVSPSRLISPMDSNAFYPREFHSLKKEMILFFGVGG